MVRTLLLSLIITLSFHHLFAQSPSDSNSPVTYNNYIVAEQSRLMDKVVEYIIQTVHNDNYREVESKRLEVIGQIEQAIDKLERMKPFQDDSSMKDEALAVCQLYHEAYINDYSHINMLKQNRESSFKAMEQYFNAQDQAEHKLQQAAELFSNAQKKFATKHKMQIVEAKSDSTMQMISKVNQYSRIVFLEFFKISKLNGKCLDALNEQDVPKIENCRSTLLASSNESYQHLRKMTDFNGDDEFRSKTLAYVSYHRLFAEKDLKELAEILNTERKSNEQIDRYNGIIKTYNSDIQTLIENFNDANLRLLRKHIPNTTPNGASQANEGAKG